MTAADRDRCLLLILRLLWFIATSRTLGLIGKFNESAANDAAAFLREHGGGPFT